MVMVRGSGLDLVSCRYLYYVFVLFSVFVVTLPRAQPSAGGGTQSQSRIKNCNEMKFEGGAVPGIIT